MSESEKLAEINVPPAIKNRDYIKGAAEVQRLSAYQCHLVNCRPLSVSCFLLFCFSVCSCSAITALHSSSVAISHVITTLLPRQPCFPHEMAVQRWQLSKIRSPPQISRHCPVWQRELTRSSD